MRLFVYGTLREGECNNSLLGPDRFKVCDGWVRGRLAYVNRDDGYPVLLPPIAATTPDVVQGELWEANHYAALDVIGMELGAGYDVEHLLIYPADAMTYDDYICEALAFTWKRDHGDIIPFGDWKERN